MRGGAKPLPVLAAALVVAGGGCASARYEYHPDVLRREVARLLPDLPASEQVVPFEVPPEAIAIARRATGGSAGQAERFGRLVRAFFDPDLFGVRYDAEATTTGAETLAARRGNCVGMASAFIGLARGVGLDARYADASAVVRQTRSAGSGLAVFTGHLTAVVLIGNDRFSLDFAREGDLRWEREVDDLEALAHYQNNRGFERVAAAVERGDPADWAAAERGFRLAVAVKPTFARAWSNLGLALSRRGDAAGAADAYRRAMALDGDMAAPRVNLGALRLEAGDPRGAVAALEEAAALEPRGAHVHFLLARARLQAGDRIGAVESLRRALALQADLPGARALLEQILPAGERGG